MILSLSDQLDPPLEMMDCIWRAIIARIASYQRDVPGLPVAPKIHLAELQESIKTMQCKDEMTWQEVLEWVDRHMRVDQFTSHPCYFGLFNPAPLPLGIVADALVAAYNPQLAAWSHSPFAAELERHIVRMFGEKFGYPADSTDGTFCSGGAEANHTALLCALRKQFPECGQSGLRALCSEPVMFVGPSAHHSWINAARACGLGKDAVRTVAAAADHRMDVKDLRDQMTSATLQGQKPFLVCGTAGSTNAGLIDPLAEAAQVCKEAAVWFHVDARGVGRPLWFRNMLSGWTESPYRTQLPSTPTSSCRFPWGLACFSPAIGRPCLSASTSAPITCHAMPMTST